MSKFGVGILAGTFLIFVLFLDEHYQAELTRHYAETVTILMEFCKPHVGG